MTGRGQTARDDKHGFVSSVVKSVSQPSPAVPPRIDIALKCSLFGRAVACSVTSVRFLGYRTNRDLAFYPPNHSTIIETFTTNLFLVLCFLRKRECNSSEKPGRVSNLRPLQSKVDVQLAQT